MRRATTLIANGTAAIMTLAFVGLSLHTSWSAGSVIMREAIAAHALGVLGVAAVVIKVALSFVGSDLWRARRYDLAAICLLQWIACFPWCWRATATVALTRLDGGADRWSVLSTGLDRAKGGMLVIVAAAALIEIISGLMPLIVTLVGGPIASAISNLRAMRILSQSPLTSLLWSQAPRAQTTRLPEHLH